MTLRSLSQSLLRRAIGAVALAVPGVLCLPPAAAQVMLPDAVSAGTPAPGATGGPMRLRPAAAPQRSEGGANVPDQRVPATAEQPAPPPPSEFERFVAGLAGGEVRRLGAGLVTSAQEPDAPEAHVTPPADYVVAPGDEVLLLLWGSVDADLRLIVDRTGRISIPRVGAVQVGGVRNADLQGVIERRVSTVFKGFQLSVSLGQLRGMRVFVTGFVSRPGSYTVPALSTAVTALMRAGGPSGAGSFRRIEVKREGQVVAQLDLYDLLLKGDRSADRLLQAGDVVHVGPVATQIAVIGSVNQAVIAELLPTERVEDALVMAGGFSAVADRGRLTVERLQERATLRVAELQLPRDAKLALSHGDVVRALSVGDTAVSTTGQNKRVRIEGEVLRPGDYVLPSNSTLRDAIRVAGGLSPAAFVFGAEFTRESVRTSQRENYERALRDLETDLARNVGATRTSTADAAARAESQAAANARLIQRMRALQPTGRVVLQLSPESAELPDLVLESGDRLYIPARSTTVGVFGSVFNSGSYLYSNGRTLDDYLRLAGGPTKGADEASVFVVRANGQVLSRRQSGGWFSRDRTFASTLAEPGDTLFVPEEMDRTTFVQAAVDWTTILYQFGLGIAGIMAATR